MLVLMLMLMLMLMLLPVCILLLQQDGMVALQTWFPGLGLYSK
jgi:hypothetical protein